jgi:hypothetical protein
MSTPDLEASPLLGCNALAFPSKYTHTRANTRAFLTTRTKHYIVMGLVALDVVVILADVFVALIACDMHLPKEGWVAKTREGLHITAAVFSSLFLVELLVTVWAYGIRYVPCGGCCWVW